MKHIKIDLHAAPTHRNRARSIKPQAQQFLFPYHHAEQDTSGPWAGLHVLSGSREASVFSMHAFAVVDDFGNLTPLKGLTQWEHSTT